MTPDQEDALIAWAQEITRVVLYASNTTEPRLRGVFGRLCKAFGYTETDFAGRPIKPKPPAVKPVVVPGLGQAQRQAFVNRDLRAEALATSDPEGHRQLLADLDHAAKHEEITALLAERKACNFTYHAKASDIMHLWSELKAIMEPGIMCIDQLVKMEKTDDHK